MSKFQIFSPDQIDSLRRGGAILSACLEHVTGLVEPGITTKELDRAAEDFIRSHDGATPAFQGYQNYPATLCTSVNADCVHGIPNDYALQEGDIIAIDCGVLLDRLYTDASRTVGVGQIDGESQRLIDVTQAALDKGVSLVSEGVHTGDISAAIQTLVEGAGFVTVIGLTGHGLGDTLHQFPDIPNQGVAGSGPQLPAHTLIAIEPIVSAGANRIKEAPDKWTLTIADGARSGHIEHSVLVLEDGFEIIA